MKKRSKSRRKTIEKSRNHLREGKHDGDGGIYRGMAEIFGSFYPSLLSRFHYFDAIPDVYIDGGDVVTVLGYYKFIKMESESFRLVRFAHTWGIDIDGRIKGAWQVADSAQFITSDKTDASY